MTPLTPRELEVLQLFSHGHTAPQAAERLGIATETVRTHLAHARFKLGAVNTANAVYLAMRRGLFP